MSDDPFSGAGGCGGHQGEHLRGRTIRPSAAGSPALKHALGAGSAWVAGAAGSILVILQALPACRPGSAALAAAVAAWGLSAPLVSPRAAFAVLIASAGVLPGLPRLWHDFGAPHLFLILTVATAGSLLARSLWVGEPFALDRRIWKWGGGFLAVALASAIASSVRGYSLFFILRGGIEPHVVNSLGMLARDRWIEASELLLVFTSLLPLADAAVRLVRSSGAFVLRSAVAACLLAGFGGVLGKVVPQEPGSYWVAAERIGGLMTDPNALGIGLSLLLPLVAAAAIESGAWFRGAAAFSLLVSAWALELSGSRSGLLLLLVAALAGGLAVYRIGGRARTVVVSGGAGLFAVMAVGLILVPRSEKIAAGGLLERLGAGLREGSLSRIANSRTVYWAAAWDTVRTEPVSGCGLAGFAYEFPFWFEKRYGPARFTDNTTNGFLDVAAECGLPALFLAAAAIWPLISAVCRVIWRGSGKTAGAIAGAATVTGFCVILLWGSHIRNPEVAVWTVVPAAFVLAAGSEPISEKRLLSAREEFPGGEDDAGIATGGAGTGRALWILAGSGVVGALLSLQQTAKPAWAFRTQPWAGLHGGSSEALSDGVPHWSGASLYRQVRMGERSIRLAFRNLRPDGRSVLATIDVDGVPAGAVSLESGEERWLRVEPLWTGAEAVRVRFDPTFVPHELDGSPDRRRLGVVVLPAQPGGTR